MSLAIFWFRRDLRLEDNTGLFFALKENDNVLPLFIFDEEILNELPTNDARVTFIHEELEKIDLELKKHGASLLTKKGNPVTIWKELIEKYPVTAVYYNKDYEPYARERDQQVASLLQAKNITCKAYKDQVIFEENDVLKSDQTPYTVFTPYKNKWLSVYQRPTLLPPVDYAKFLAASFPFPSLSDLGFTQSTIRVLPYNLDVVDDYKEKRDYPALNATSYLSPHLRFGTVSVRQVIHQLKRKHESFVNELIWREFFMQILFHFPHVVKQNFKAKYDHIPWRNKQEEFERWCKGETGFPIVDAGMRELNATGYMHNRVRMITAGFLCKHLLIDWRWGEAYFAEKLLDYELSSNNGNWQWAAGTGCDAAPYFRVFNPSEQIKKFDPDYLYVKKWVPEFATLSYPQPMVDHKQARLRAIETYKKALS